MASSNQRQGPGIPTPRAAGGGRVVGFTAGVFDLLHVGHLRLLESAKKRCDHLCVGVISDEISQILKGKTPVIPLSQRMELVSALRCVDEVVAIEDEHHLSKVEAWYEWPFDVAFTGDDHEGDPYWQMEGEVLRELGARIEYLPYTECTSTTKIREDVCRLGGEPDR